jgi:hypothetical protein
MPYTQEGGGRLNNFAVEPKMYEAAPPTANEKRNYTILGIVAAVFMVGIVVVAYTVSVSQSSY